MKGLVKKSGAAVLYWTTLYDAFHTTPTPHPHKKRKKKKEKRKKESITFHYFYNYLFTHKYRYTFETIKKPFKSMLNMKGSFYLNMQCNAIDTKGHSEKRL